jgi:response regulator RpfG family c-di-GMP phosphodiesterase
VLIMLTGVGDLKLAVQALHDGRIFRFLAKPCPYEQLAAAIADATAQHESYERELLLKEQLQFSKETLEGFTELLEERISAQTAALRRMNRFALDLNGARSIEEIAERAAQAASEILGGRGVHVQVWDPAGPSAGVEAGAGPEMSTEMHREPLSSKDGMIGEIVVDRRTRDGEELTEIDRGMLASLASSTAVAVHNELRRRERDQAQHATIIALACLSEQRDNETGKHLERVSLYCKLVAEGLRSDGKHLELISDAWIEDLVRSAPLHDIGKVGIPDSILLKPGKLTPEEWEIMKTHTQIGAETLEAVIANNGEQGFLAMSRDIAWCHHEKWDGSGYPRALRGEQIPLSARILALADVYDALTTVRPYKHAWSHREALDWIRTRAGTHFDPDVVAAFAAREQQADAVRARLADVLDELPSQKAHSAF